MSRKSLVDGNDDSDVLYFLGIMDTSWCGFATIASHKELHWNVFQNGLSQKLPCTTAIALFCRYFLFGGEKSSSSSKF